MATRWDKMPNLNEDVVKGVSEDVGKVTKSTSNLKGAAVDAVKEAGGRAAKRLVGRAGLAGLALQSGYDAGRAIDEATGVGKKMVDESGLGDAAAQAATSGDRVTLTKEAQDRIAKGDLDKKPTKKAPARAKPAAKSSEDDSDEGYVSLTMKKGGRVSASKRADGIATKGFTKGRYI